MKLPNRLRRQVITLNLEDRCARLLTCRGKQVQKWGSMPLEAGLVRDGLVLDPREVGRKIRALFQEHRVSRKGVVASLTGAHSISRLLELPQMKPALLGSAVFREAKREMPVPLDRLYFSWQAVARNDGRQQVFALGVPRDILDAQIEALREAGVTLRTMDLKPLALVRAVNRSQAIIVNLEAGSLDIVIVVNSFPGLMRTIALEEEFAPQERGALLERELVQTLDFYNTSHGETSLPPNIPLYLSGELVEVPIPEAAIGHSVHPLSPPLEYGAELPLAQYMVNLGLALKKG